MGTGLFKLVNGEAIELTKKEADERTRLAEERDKNITEVRGFRDDILKETDAAVSVSDYPLPTGTVDEWKAYRAELRNCLTSFEKRSTFNYPKSPIVAKAGQDAYDAKKSAGLVDDDYIKEGKDPADADEASAEDKAALLETRAGVERSAAERTAGYPRSGLTNTR